MDLCAFKLFVQELTTKSGGVIRPFFANHSFAEEEKDDRSPVTFADRLAEEVLREHIHKRFPNHGVIGEEFGSEGVDREFVWVLDPIDGTASFITGCPLFGTLIGLLHRGKPVLGAIHQPLLDQLCIGDNLETTLNGRLVAMRPMASLSDATVLATDLANIAKYHDYATFEKLRQEAKLFRTWGDCYGYLLLASGLADVMVDPILKPWDLLPLIPVIRGAGGVITSWYGDDPAGAKGDSCVAAHPSLHTLVLDRLNGPGRGRPK